MKLSRIVATGAAAALVGVSTLAIGGSASAADFYVTDGDIGSVADGEPYLDSWFSGDVSPGTQGTAVTTAAGLELSPAGSGYQLLNGDVAAPADLQAILTGASFAMSAGSATFQVPMFYDSDADGTQEFTTLRPAATNTLSGEWMSSSAIMGPDGTTTVFAANTAFPLADMLAEMPDYEVLAFGVFADTAATVASITWEGNTHYFTAEVIEPAPTGTITPSSLTEDEMESTGVVAVFTGFWLEEQVEVSYSNGSLGDFIGTFTANGGVVTVPFSGTLAPGNYTMSASGLESELSADVAFVVTENPAELAATGADFTPQILAGSVLLLLGGAVTFAARRRMVAQSN